MSSDNKLLYDQKNNYQGIINIGTGKDITIKELVNTISELFEYEGKIVWDHNNYSPGDEEELYEKLTGL